MTKQFEEVNTLKKRQSHTSALGLSLGIRLTTRSSRRLTIFHTHEFEYQEYITARKRGGHKLYYPTNRLSQQSVKKVDL